MLARRRRPGAEVPAVVEHSERGASSSPARTESRIGSGNLFGMFGAPARCASAQTSAKPQGLVPGFGYYVRTTVANAVHSGNGRTAANDDNTDYYPVPLKQETLRPGTIYADPYGHVLVLVKRVPQTGDARGRLPRRRRAARRDGRAQALLARQFPVRAGSRARQSRVQALPADRAREERRLAAADQRRDRRRSAVRRFFARSVAARRSKTSTIAWTT